MKLCNLLPCSHECVGATTA